MVTLPAQAAAKPAYQLLADLVKNYGEYDASIKAYNLVYYYDDDTDLTCALSYDSNDSSLYCWIFGGAFYEKTYMVLTPNLYTPYTVVTQTMNSFAAKYSFYPGSYTEKTKLHYTEYSGHPVYQDEADVQVNAFLPLLVDSINSLMILMGTSYRVKDLGFTKFNYHSMHVDTEPEVVGELKCGNNRYSCRCLVCGRTASFDKWEDHIKGDIIWEKEASCTEEGRGQYTCARCGERIPDAGARAKALGHDWEIVSLDAPVNDEEHVQGQFRCKRCGEEKTGEYCAADFFKDMPARDNWAHTPIDWAFASGITAGTSATQFSPAKGCTRGQVVTFLWRVSGCPEPESTEMPFVDVKAGSFYEKAVVWAVENGITNGVTESTFCPDRTCTRGQIVTFLWRAAGCPEPENTESAFRDLKKGGFYLDAVAWAVENEVTNGLSADTFGPDANCTRAQVVTFLHRAKNIPGPAVVIPEPELTEVNAFLIRGASLDCMDISEGGTEKTTLLNTHDQIDGADISMEDAKKAAFWTESMGFNAAVFAIADGSYPILSSLNLFE